jgi:hypothetical protein
MKEKRVYIVDLSHRPDGQMIVSRLSDDEFISMAEQQGNVWSLDNFPFAWWRGDLPSYDNAFMRMKVKTVFK